MKRVANGEPRIRPAQPEKVAVKTTPERGEPTEQAPAKDGSGKTASRRIAGPSQDTARSKSLRADAAVNSALLSLRRLTTRLGRTDIHQSDRIDKVIGGIDQAARAYSTAATHPDIDDRSKEHLAEALANVLQPLSSLTLHLMQEMPIQGRKTERRVKALEDGYARLLAPTAGIFPETAPPARTGAGEFVPIEDATQIAKSAFAKFQSMIEKRDKDHRRSTGRPAPKLTEETEAAIFRAVFTTEQKGLVTSIDAGVFDFLPMHLAKAVTRDHHGPHFDPQHPLVSTTMLIAKEIERMRARPISNEEKIARLENEFRSVTTNNLGDAIFARVLTRHLPELVEKGGIEIAMKSGTKSLLSLDLIYRLGRFEDFDFFGTAQIGEGKKRSAPKQIVFRDLAHIVLADYQVFDELLAQFGVKGSDRIDSLSREDQAKIVTLATNGVEENLANYETRLERSTTFKASVEKLKGDVSAAHDALRTKLKDEGLPAQDLATLDDKVFYFLDTLKGGRFATWDAPSLSHKAMISWGAIPFGQDKWGFVLSVPAGRTPSFLDTAMTAAFKEQLPKAIVRGDTLMFVFNPADGTVPPIEMAKILAEQIRKHEIKNPVEGPKEDPKDPISLIGRNIISHDAYIYDDEGNYQWTPAKFDEAHKLSMEAFKAAIRDPACKKVTLVMGLPGSGKTTWIGKHDSPTTVFFDSTFTTRAKRAEVIKEANKAGKEVELVWIDTPLEKCLERNLVRTDREIPESWMRARDTELRAQAPTKKAEDGVHKFTVVRPR